MQDTAENIRLTARAVGEFVLRWAEIAGPSFQGDLTSLVIYTAVVQANVREIWDDPELNRRYADTPPPDELRRPVAMSAIADSLNLPRETVRRHVGKMIEFGAMVKKDGGVIVPRHIVDSPDGMEVARQLHANVRRLVLTLRRAGVDFAAGDGE